MSEERYQVELLPTCELWIKDKQTGFYTFVGLPDLLTFFERHPDIKEMFCEEMMNDKKRWEHALFGKEVK